MMEGVQKHGGGGCGLGDGQWRGVQCSVPRRACCSRLCQKHHTDIVKPCHLVLPRKQKKKNNVNNNKQRGSIDGRRMHRAMLPMGHGMCADHARLTLTLAAQYGGW